jgi:hypothetical protein
MTESFSFSNCASVVSGIKNSKKTSPGITLFIEFKPTFFCGKALASGKFLTDACGGLFYLPAARFLPAVSISFFTFGVFARGAFFSPAVCVLFLPAAYFARGAFFSPAVRVLFFTCGLLPAELFFHVRKHLAKRKKYPRRDNTPTPLFYLPAAGTLSLITL